VKITRNRIGAFLLAFSILPTLAGAQTEPKKSSRPQHQPVSSVSPFNPQVEALPPRFAGHNAEAVYDLIRGKLPNPSKSEFESQAEYLARAEEFAGKPFVANAKPSDLFAFCLSGHAMLEPVPAELDLFRNLETEYYAEAHTLTVTLPSYWASPSEYTWSSIWRTSSHRLGEYIGSNAFGVKRAITRWAQNDSIIVIHDFSWLSPDCDYKFRDVSCVVNMDGGTARSLSANLRVLIIGRLVAPFISSENYTGQPTIDAPAEIHHYQRFLHVQIEQLWLVDGVTGRVIEKYSRERHAAEYPVNVEFRVRATGTFSYPDARCKDFESHVVSLDYSVDGSAYRHEYVGVLRTEAQHFVDVKIQYCNASRVEVLLNGQPFHLECERQERFIYNSSQCNRIQLGNR